MLVDIVVDTNVFAHCSNAIEPRAEAALEFIRKLLAGSEKLCVDPGFHMNEALNKSIIGHEYLTHLPFGTLGAAAVAALAGSLRVVELPRRPSTRGIKKKVDQLVKDKGGDRTFVGVASNSTERVFVSHDYADFSTNVRKALLKEVNVCVISAEKCMARL